MTKPRKPAAMPKTTKDAAAEVVEAPVEAAEVKAEEANPVTSEPEPEAAPIVEAAADQDEPATPDIRLPLIDGTDPAWAISAVIGARHIEFTAHDNIEPADVVHTLAAKSVTIPGHDTPTLIAARTITPPKLRPVRVTFTVRERIAG